METEIRKQIEKTMKECIRENVRASVKLEVHDAVTLSVLPIFTKMLQDSEQRVEAMNKIVQKLADTCSANIKAHEKQISELQKSKALTQENMTRLIEANKELTKQLEALVNQINTLSTDFRERNNSAEKHHRELTEKYVHLAEISVAGHRSGSSNSTSDVKIDVKH